MKADSDFIYRKEDLVTLRPGRESAWLDAFVERFLKMINCKPVQVRSFSFQVAGKTYFRTNSRYL